MSRSPWLLVVFACFTFSGCGDTPTIEAPDEAAATETTAVEETLKDAGMEGMSTEEYLNGGKKSE